MNYIWKNGEFVLFENATTHLMTHALHYGSAAFEGIRAYQTDDQKTAVLCLDQHIERLIYSAKALFMEIPFSKEQIKQAVIDTVKKNNYASCYIRPLIYYGFAQIQIMPKPGTPIDLMIACYELKNYLPKGPIHVKVSDFIRIHNKSTNVEAKISGHYVNNLQALMQIRGTKYSEILMLDHRGYVAEGSGENIFMVKDGIIYTPSKGSILNGITRQVIIELCHDFGYKLIETDLQLEQLFKADEILLCGTAVEIAPVASIDDTSIADGNPGIITQQLQNEYSKICKGAKSKYFKYLTYVN